MLQLINNSIPIAEGLFRYRPSQSAAYALSNLINQSQGIVNQLESTVNYKELSSNLMEEVIKPILESIVLELGQAIRKELKKSGSSVPKKGLKIIRQVIDNIYINFGKVVEQKVKKLDKEIFKFINH